MHSIKCQFADRQEFMHDFCRWFVESALISNLSNINKLNRVSWAKPSSLVLRACIDWNVRNTLAKLVGVCARQR